MLSNYLFSYYILYDPFIYCTFCRCGGVQRAPPPCCKRRRGTGAQVAGRRTGRQNQLYGFSHSQHHKDAFTIGMWVCQSAWNTGYGASSFLPLVALRRGALAKSSALEDASLLPVFLCRNKTYIICLCILSVLAVERRCGRQNVTYNE